MTEKLAITYINCDFCTAKNHCAACGAELSHSLEQKPGVTAAAVNLREHTLQITYELERGVLEDLLDGMGLLAG